MNQRTSIVRRRSLRAYAAAFISYVLLVGQVAPLALAAAPKPSVPATAAPAATAPAPLKAAPMPAPMPVFAPGITATKVDAFPDPNGNLKAEPGDTITYTVTINNAGPDPATGVTFTDSVDPNTSLVPGSVKTQPIAVLDTYTASGNIPISLAAPGVLTNDRDPDTGNNTGLTVTKVGPNVGSLNAANVGVAMDTTAAGRGAVKGSVNLAANGGFTYEPPPGFEGADTFAYETSDGTLTDTQTVTINVGGASGMVWFIQSGVASSNRGTFSQPFTTIGAFNTANAGTGAVPDPKNGDFIALRTGSGIYTETDGINLRAQQKVIGNGVAFNSSFTAAADSSSAYTNFASAGSPAAAPNIVATAGNGVDLAANNTLRGFNIGNTGATGTDISGTAFGTLTVSNLSINGDGRALNLTNGTLAATIDNITASNTGSNAGLVLNGVGGALTVSGSTTVTNPGGNGIDISNAPAGASFNFGTATVSKNAAGTAVNLATNNAGATTSFTSLAVTNSSGAGIVANAGGTLNAPAGSITTTGTGVAASFTNTALGLAFTSVSSNGGANGLIFSGGTGSFTSGTTNLQNNAGIGLLMSASAVAANFGNTTVNSSAGDAVDLSSNTAAITFADLDLTPDAGLRGLDAQNNTQAITVTSGDITTSGGGTASAVFVDGPVARTPINLTFTSVTTSGVGSGSASVSLVDVSGTKFQVTGTTQINTRSGRGVFVDNSTATTIQFATTNIPNPSAAGGNGFHVEDSSSAVTVATATISDANVTVAQNDSNNDFIPDTDGDGDAIFLKNNTGSFTLSGGTLSNCGNDCIDVRNSQNLVVTGVTMSSPGQDVTGATGTGFGGHGIAATNLTGTNTVTNSTITNWEVANRDGLVWINDSATAGTITVHGTTFSDSANGASAIFTSGRNAANMTLNVGGTSAGQPCNFTELDAFAIISNAGDNAGSTATVNLNIRNNTFTNTAEKGNNGVAARNLAGGKSVIVVSGNTFDGGGRTAADTAGMIDIGGDATDAGNFLHFTVTNNIIRNIGDNIAGSCGALECHGKRGIDVFIDDNTVVGNDSTAALDADDAVVIDGNIITNVQRTGIQFDIGQVYNGSDIAAKITNNRVGIRADNTIDRVGKGDALNAGGEWAILVENRTQNVKNLNILVSNNLFYNGNGGAGSTLNGSGMLMRTQRGATMSGTVTNNTFNVSMASSAFGINVGTVNTGAPVLCLDASGNTISAPGGGINIAESVGTLNVEQASSAALSAANGGASVNIATGTPSFGVACSTPPAAPDSFDSELGQAPAGGGPAVAPAEETAPTALKGDASGEVTARPTAAPRATTAAPKAVAPKAAAPKAVKAEAKRDAGTTFRYAAEATSAPLNPAPEPVAQRRKGIVTPVLKDDDAGPPNGAGGTVTVNIGTLPANDLVTITFQVVVDDPYSGGPNVSNQGRVTGTNFTTVNGVPTTQDNTDDPDTGTNAPGEANPTLTPINSIDIRIQDAKVAEPASPNTVDMVFTVSLSQPAGGPVSVNFATADGSATAGTCGDPGADYVSTSGTVNFAAGQQVKTVNVPICSDAAAEGDETFTVTLSGAAGGNIVDATATGTITVNTPGTFLISEVRTSGPGGAGDDFVEFYNNSNSPLTVAASDASAGYGIFKMGATCADTPVLIGAIPNGTVIPARGHYLLVGSQYSLANYGGTGAAAGNLTMSSDIENDRNVAVFTTTNIINIASANRLDAVGFGLNAGAVCDLFREPSNLPAVSGSDKNYSFFRNLCDFGVTGCTGDPKDTNDNTADFKFADTEATIISGVQQRLGAPGPENIASPIRRDTSGINLPMLDQSQSSAAAPNRVRTFGMETNATFGTLLVRRRVVNNTSGPVTRLRFRVIELSTLPSPGGGVADLRALTAPAAAGVSIINDSATCGGPSACTVTAQGTTLEEPPAQTNGGGINSTLSLTLGTPLGVGNSIPLQFKLGIMTTGTYRFYIIVEALP